MKKVFRTIALALAMAMMMGITAFAAPKVEAETGKNVSADITSEKITSLTYTDGKIAKDGQYMIFVVSPDGENYIPTASSILYINQMQAAGNGAITFENIFPKIMKNSGIMISGTGLTGPELIAKILAALLGDINLDTDITAADLTALARHVAKIELITDSSAFVNADVNCDDDASAADLTLVAKYVAKIIDSFN